MRASFLATSINTYHQEVNQFDDGRLLDAPWLNASLLMQSENRILLGAVEFDQLTELETCKWIGSALDRGEAGFVVTANLDHLLRCKRSQEYLRLVNQASLVVADGMPLIWASRIQGTPLPERVAGSSLCLSLAQSLASAGRSIFLLGGDPGVAANAAQILKDRFPGLTIAGAYSPPFGFEKDPIELNVILTLLADSGPDVVYVALGSPKQEKLIEQLRDRFPSTWWIGVGISLSFITGDIKRAPRWVQLIGCEWVHRLVQEPRRLARRYLIDGIPFAVELLVGSAMRRLRN